MNLVRRLGAGRLIPALVAGGAAVAAGVAFGRVFGFGNVIVPLILAAVVGAGAVLVIGVLVAGLVVDAVAATPTGVGQGISGLFGGWSRILTTSVPVPPTPDRLPVLAGVVALGVALAMVAASRTHPGVDALLPAGLVLLVALALGVGGPGSVVAVSAAPAILAGAYLLVVSRPADEGVAWVPPARSFAAVGTGAVVVIVALVVGSSWPLATARTPVDLRSHLNPPVDLGQVANPLELLPRVQGEAGTTIFTARVDATWVTSPTDWRLVSMDAYDGTGWSTSAQATRAGNVLSLPAGEDASVLGPASSQQVTVQHLQGPWVPTTGVPTSVKPADLAYDPATSILVAGGDLDGRSFSLTSRIPSPSKAALDSAGIPVSIANAQLTQVPACTPTALTALAAKAAAGASRPDDVAANLEQALAKNDGFALDPAATPGSSCGRLQQFLTARQGTVEQFATAFALMARSQGLPARVVVGFTPGAVDSASGTTTVRGGDATVWPEIDFAHLGWVAFSPVPASTTPGQQGGAASTTTTVDPSQRGLNQVRGTAATPNSTAPPGQPGPSTVPGAVHHASGAWSWWYLVPILVVALALAFVALRLGARRRRRARRRDPSRPPASRVTGAWAEVLDALAAFDPDVGSLTPTEVTLVAARSAAGAEEPVRTLGVLVDDAVYGGVADAAAADAAWALSDRAAGALRHAVPGGLRLRHLLAGGPRRSQAPGPVPAAVAVVPPTPSPEPVRSG